jgi:hypothetical protein
MPSSFASARDGRPGRRTLTGSQCRLTSSVPFFRIGYDADTTAIGIYVDGVEIAHYAGTSPDDALDWQALSFSFVGTGGPQILRIVTEATRRDANGRGAMLDKTRVRVHINDGQNPGQSAYK